MTLAAVPSPRHDLPRRELLRIALERRQQELGGALWLYEEVTVPNAARAALINRTRRALGEIELALRRLQDHNYGTCKTCHRALRTSTLTVQPLADRCPNCASSEAM